MIAISRYCKCGGAIQIKCSQVTTADFLVGQFDRLHTGEGHGSATRQQAANARRREDRLASVPPEGGER